jgi:4-alpha-glucanotransferase
MRRSGVILPIFSLPSNYGIGSLGKEAYNFVDFLVKAKQSYWQILPIGPTSYGDSPYQSFSTFAGNPYFIDLDSLIDDGILEKNDVEKYSYGMSENYIDYGTMYKNRFGILRIAYNTAYLRYEKGIRKFREDNKEWIEDYALFMAIKNYFKDVAWKEWDNDIKHRKPEAIKRYTNLLKDDIEFYIFLQYLFYKQWIKLKDYANKKGIGIIGDIPIYVAEDSVDIWANPEYFLLDKKLNPIKVAGCPPDAFSSTGQLWGNPVYNWETLKATNYKWWVDRIKGTLNIFDVIRIDHFRGLQDYWAVPYGDKTAINGKWDKGPGIDLFNVIKEELGDLNIIAEDLGYLTNDVRELLNKTGYPGMKVLQFAFDPSGQSEYLPHNYCKKSVVYTGTHDNDTIKGWFNSLREDEKDFCKRYTGVKGENDNWILIKSIISSSSNLAIMQMQDLLNKGSEARINIPSTIGKNWRWRMSKSDMRSDISLRLAELTQTYGRY